MVSLVTLRQLVTDKYTTETIDTAVLDRIIAAAVRFYSRYNPVYTISSITTVADQQLYDLPADCMTLIGVNYWPGDVNSGIINAAYEWPYSYSTDDHYDQISLRVIDEIKRSEAARRASGFWEQRGTQIYLSPIPSTSGTLIPIIYGGLHLLNGAATAYETIPTADLDIIKDLVLAEYLEGRRLDLSTEPDYAEGHGRLVKHFLPRHIKEAVADLRYTCIAKYGEVPAG